MMKNQNIYTRLLFFIFLAQGNFSYCSAQEAPSLPSVETQEQATSPVSGNSEVTAQASATLELPEAPEIDPEDLKNPFITSLPAKDEILVESTSFSVAANEEASSQEDFDYSGLIVTGIVWGNDMPKAIIDDRVVGIGDTINDATITNISKEGILFRYKNKDYLMKRGGRAEKK